MRTAQINRGNAVVNVIEAPEGYELDGFTLVASETAQIGDIYDELGGSFTTPSMPAPVPNSVSRPQARIALRRATRIDEVDALVASIGGETADWWNSAAIIERANPLVASLGAALSPPLSSDDIDGLFRTAATIL